MGRGLTSDHTAGDLPYGADKGVMDRITTAAARELAHPGVTCNAIDPGPADTGWTTEGQKADLIRSTPPGRLGVPQDARVSSRSSAPPRGWINAQLLRSDCGLG